MLGIDWSQAEQHMFDRHGITPMEAEEALTDESRVVFNPDYNSIRGDSTWSDDMKDVDTRVAEIAAEAEAGEADQTDRPLPPHVAVTRPGLARSKVLQVRLNPEELEALERYAAARELPVSTVARGAILRYLNPPKDVDAVRLVDEFARFLASR